MSKRENVMRKVQALLDKAASTTFDGERDSLLAKADELMAVYAIEQFELDMARPAKDRERPEVRVVETSTAGQYELRFKLNVLFRSLARHCGVMIGSSSYIGGSKTGWKVVGYRSDIDWMEMLYLNIQLHMLSRMEPKPDPAKSEAENFGLMREAGMDYKRIFDLMGWEWVTKVPGHYCSDDRTSHESGVCECACWGCERERKDHNGHGDLTGSSAKKLRAVRKAYHDLCEAEGRKPVKGLKAETYRESFMEGYVDRIEGRLTEMRRARETATAGKGLVLATRDDDLREAFFVEFPDLRPHPKDCECDSCHFSKCNDESCTRPRCERYWKDAKKPVKYRAPKDPKVDHDARSRGKAVADMADLSGGRGNVSGVRGEI